jgi:hypothetical protein
MHGNALGFERRADRNAQETTQVVPDFVSNTRYWMSGRAWWFAAPLFGAHDQTDPRVSVGAIADDTQRAFVDGSCDCLGTTGDGLGVPARQNRVQHQRRAAKPSAGVAVRATGAVR